MCVLSDSCKTDSPNLKEKLCKQKISFLQSLTFVDLQLGGWYENQWVVL